jgi:uncharacterized membrane protein
VDLIPRNIAYLLCSVLLVGLAVQTSDIATIRQRELSGDTRFEYPVLARALYLLEREVAGTPTGIALVNAGLGIAAAVGVTWLISRRGGSASLWMASPTLMLVGVNVDAITALSILLALQSWKNGHVAGAGVCIGLGAAFKLAPFVLLFPLLGASDWRGAARLLLAATVCWLAVNVPYALAYPDAWSFPYTFASLRHDGLGTIWAALDLDVRATNIASTLTLVVLGASIAVAVRFRKIHVETGAAVALLALLVTSKIWQPHYLLWALPALTLAGAPNRPVRVMEVANLACFFVLWRQLPTETAALWLWAFCAARLAALAWVVLCLLRRDLSQRTALTQS